MIDTIKKMFTTGKSRDSSWLTADASSAKKREMLKRVIDKSNEDQREVIDEYRKSRSS